MIERLERLKDQFQNEELYNILLAVFKALLPNAGSKTKERVQRIGVMLSLEFPSDRNIVRVLFEEERKLEVTRTSQYPVKVKNSVFAASRPPMPKPQGKKLGCEDCPTEEELVEILDEIPVDTTNLEEGFNEEEDFELPEDAYTETEGNEEEYNFSGIETLKGLKSYLDYDNANKLELMPKLKDYMTSHNIDFKTHRASDAMLEEFYTRVITNTPLEE